MKDKRDECGCHRDCPMEPHDCIAACSWPSCLTDDEHRELLAELDATGPPPIA